MAYKQRLIDYISRFIADLANRMDFTTGVQDDYRAGIKPTLEAAGVLDVWATPDGAQSSG